MGYRRSWMGIGYWLRVSGLVGEKPLDGWGDRVNFPA